MLLCIIWDPNFNTDLFLQKHYDESKFIVSRAEIQCLRWGLSSGYFNIMSMAYKIICWFFKDLAMKEMFYPRKCTSEAILSFDLWISAQLVFQKQEDSVKSFILLRSRFDDKSWFFKVEYFDVGKIFRT